VASCGFGKCIFGKLPLGKLSLEKSPLGKCLWESETSETSGLDYFKTYRDISFSMLVSAA